MSTADRGGLAAPLGELRAGDDGARGRLVRAIYGERCHIAGGLVRRERPDRALLPASWSTKNGRGSRREGPGTSADL
jgi:hypothetical protein